MSAVSILNSLRAKANGPKKPDEPKPQREADDERDVVVAEVAEPEKPQEKPKPPGVDATAAVAAILDLGTATGVIGYASGDTVVFERFVRNKDGQRYKEAFTFQFSSARKSRVQLM